MSRDYGISNATTLFTDMSFYDAVEVMQELGIKVQDETGSFRLLSDIINDVSKVWRRTLDRTTSRLIEDASQRLVDSFKDEGFEDDNEELDDFLSSFARSD